MTGSPTCIALESAIAATFAPGGTRSSCSKRQIGRRLGGHDARRHRVAPEELHRDLVHGVHHVRRRHHLAVRRDEDARAGLERSASAPRPSRPARGLGSPPPTATPSRTPRGRSGRPPARGPMPVLRRTAQRAKARGPVQSPTRFSSWVASLILPSLRVRDRDHRTRGRDRVMILEDTAATSRRASEPLPASGRCRGFRSETVRRARRSRPGPRPGGPRCAGSTRPT